MFNYCCTAVVQQSRAKQSTSSHPLLFRREPAARSSPGGEKGELSDGSLARLSRHGPPPRHHEWIRMRDARIWFRLLRTPRKVQPAPPMMIMGGDPEQQHDSRIFPLPTYSRSIRICVHGSVRMETVYATKRRTHAWYSMRCIRRQAWRSTWPTERLDGAHLTFFPSFRSRDQRASLISSSVANRALLSVLTYFHVRGGTRM